MAEEPRDFEDVSVEDDGVGQTGSAGVAQTEEYLKAEATFKSGANWFYWIAGLSLVNTVIMLTGSDWNFVIGLGVMLLADVIAHEIGGAAIVAALIFDVVVAGVFVLFGLFSGKGHRWAFIVGMVLYALDGLIYLNVGDWLSVGFHAFALWCIFVGFRARIQLGKMER